MVSAEGRTDRPLLDPAVMEELRNLRIDGGPDVLTEMIEMFLGNTPSRLQDLRAAAAAGDAAGVAWIGHSLKGSSGIFGATEMVRLCEQLQESAHAADAGDATAAGNLAGLVEALIAEYHRVAAELRAYLQH